MRPWVPNTGTTRRALLKAGAVVAAAPALQLASRAAGSGRPNILLLMTDQHRGDCLGSDGNAVLQTPNLDRLARGGVRFRCAYSSTPTCTPARAALLTGMSPWSHGMLGYGAVAEHYPVEMPQLLRNAGYYTLGIGKMHWTPQRALHGFHRTILDESGREESPGFRSDYRSWLFSEAPEANPEPTGISWNGYAAKPFPLPERLHPTAWVAETAIHFLRGYGRPEPWFLKVSFERPHSPYDPPPRWMDRYADAPLPPARAGRWAEKNRPADRSIQDPWHGDFGAEAVRRARQGYYGSISFIDEQIGRILETLDGRGQLRDTLIFLLADHGDMLGDQYLWRKGYAYQPSARVPMLLHWPGGLDRAHAGRVVGQPVEIRDVLPTLLDGAGVPVPPAVEGRSLLGLVRGDGRAWREWIDLEHDVVYSPENHWNALTDGVWKYIFHADSGAEQLFHLAEDPYELVDLSGDAAYSAERNQWRSRLIAHLAPRGEPWVVKGALGIRKARQLYSPHYPG
ncbi:MAG TPA: arylsulfatase [Verrucomicrobiae bacterium]|nr:arylsulfatase [Verrucomicrobiae bacterium]